MTTDAELDPTPTPIVKENTHPRWSRHLHRLLPAHGVRTLWSLCLAILAIALTALILNHTLPWLSFAVPLPDGSFEATRDDLRNPDAVAYEQRLLTWPLVGYGIAAGAAAALVATTYIGGRPRSLATVQAGLSWLLAYAGFLVALTGTRWLGFHWARLQEGPPTLVRLDAVPYLNLGAGFAILGVAAWLVIKHSDVRGAWMWSPIAASTAVLGLLVLPLIPFGVVGGSFRLDGLTLALLGKTQTGRLEAPEALAMARWMVWGALYASVAGALAHDLDRQGFLPTRFRWLQHAALANAVFVVAGLAFLWRFYERLPHLRDNMTIGNNPFLPLTYAGLAAVVWLHARTLAKTRRRT